MSVTLNSTLAWETAAGDDDTMLQNLQPNILKGHVRDHLSVLFLRFDDPTEGRDFLKAVHGLMKSAKDHLNEVKAFKQIGATGTPYVGVGLTAPGYAALSVPAPIVPADPKFVQPGGMRGSRTALQDPVASLLEDPYAEEIHAVVLIGDAEDSEEAHGATYQAVLALLTDTIAVVGEEHGRTLLNDNGDGIEHFGYVDGRSQPLFLDEDVDAEKHREDGTSAWDPAFPLSQVIVSDPAAPDPAVHFGSYFVFRKLEQNVAMFKEGEEDLADRLGLGGPDRELAGAMLVGRFEDGTPLTLQSSDGAHEPVINNFNYDSDDQGSKCPFHAHIRKTNPRGSGGSPGGGPTNVPFERSHIMARRGQTYGDRLDDPNADLPPEDRPSGEVGLLFMAFNANIGAQFEFTQAAWANNPTFPFASPTPAGLDPVIGQGARPQTDFPKAWGDPVRTTADTVPQAVTMKGGQYFFMPSLAFFVAL